MKPKNRPLPLHLQTTKIHRGLSEYTKQKRREFALADKKGRVKVNQLNITILGCVTIIPQFQFYTKEEKAND